MSVTLAPTAQKSLLPTPPLSFSNSISAAVTTPESPVTSSTPRPIRIPTIPSPDSLQLSLHTPLKGHLALLHPLTPSPILSFCAKRLLSPDRPYGFDMMHQKSAFPDLNSGSCPSNADDNVIDNFEAAKTQPRSWKWKPIHLFSGGFDICTAGVGMDAGKELKQNGPGKEADERLEKMYEVARGSWKLLEMKCPIGSAL
ncbi:hypothetical protein IAR55_005403 [Kwoniella newhampshirensis]|uniref:Uncharacterized protein n=1 Tax=Kwoniella newhampshirensis TaxID=1651941 RepID=A0AAW0YHC9_9TREE